MGRSEASSCRIASTAASIEDPVAATLALPKSRIARSILQQFAEQDAQFLDPLKCQEGR
jgi:hypothetical protein